MSNHNAFLIIPAYVANHPEIDDATAIFFGRLNALSNDRGHCFASDKYLAEVCKCQYRVISDRLKKLRELGFIRVVSEKKGLKWDRKIWTCNHYSTMTEEEIQKSSTKRTGMRVRDAQACAFETHGRAEEKNKREKDKKENHPLSPSSKRMDDDDFSSKKKRERKNKADLVAQKWEKEGRPKEVIQRVLETYKAQPLGSIGDIAKWMESVYAQKFEEKDADELFEYRRKFAIKMEDENRNNYFFAKDKDLLCYTSAGVEKTYNIRAKKREHEDFWRSHNLGTEQFLKFKEARNGTDSV
jgi:Helix-turn-helix domain